MQYETPDGFCVVVGTDLSGKTCRLQQFVARNFRELLGRQSDAMHVNARHSAAVACQKGYVLVDGQVATGRKSLLGGEVVMLQRRALTTLENLDVSNVSARRGAPRMLVIAQTERGAQTEMVWEREGGAHFRRFYRDVQQLLPTAEWEQCEQLFMAPVPLSLRLNLASPKHKDATWEINQACGARAEIVPWMCPFGGAMHVAPTHCPEEASAGLQLVNMLASTGEVVVQDGLSMLAAAALNVQPGHAVLDLCCAPGSKTCQLLDAISLSSLEQDRSLIVANDVSVERSERAWNRAKTQNCKPLIVTSGDGVSFPPLAEGGFDRILVDVPCSSDGTIRKEPKRLHRWNVKSALNHHSLQTRLLLHGLELLKPGGRLIYSTCCLNPIECEAVVQSALGLPSVSLLPAEDVLPPGCPRGLRGLRTWRVPDPSFEDTGVVHDVWDETLAELQSTMFPKMETSTLDRCARFLPIHGPHFGAFFLAAFTKILGLKEILKPHIRP